MLGLFASVEPSVPVVTTPAPARTPDLLERLGLAILESVTVRNAAVATLILVLVFAVARHQSTKKWPTQAEVLKFTLAMAGLPTATSIFAVSVLLSKWIKIPGLPEESHDSMHDSIAMAGLVGTIIVLIESISTIYGLLKSSPPPSQPPLPPPPLPPRTP